MGCSSFVLHYSAIALSCPVVIQLAALPCCHGNTMAGSKYSNREDTLASLTCYGDEQRVQNQQSGNHQ